MFTMEKEDLLVNSKKFEIIRSNVNGVPIRISPGKESFLKKEETRLSNLHFHDELEIINIIQGVLITELADGCRYTAKKGETVIIASRVLHKTFAIGTVLHNNLLQFKTGYFENRDDKKEGYEKYILRFADINEKFIMVSDSKELFECVNEICKEYSEENFGYDMYITSKVYAILGYLQRNGFLASHKNSLNTAKIDRLKPVLEYVNEHYNTEITVSEMSEKLGVTGSHFCRLWKNAIGAGFIDYLNFVRVSKADKLLRTTDESVLEIALKTGFSSLSYFNRVFKKIRHCSPTVYKKASKVYLTK